MSAEEKEVVSQCQELASWCTDIRTEFELSMNETSEFSSEEVDHDFEGKFEVFYDTLESLNEALKVSSESEYDERAVYNHAVSVERFAGELMEQVALMDTNSVGAFKTGFSNAENLAQQAKQLAN